MANIMKENNFIWPHEAKHAFVELKQVIVHRPVLALLDSTKTFYTECDACNYGVRAVLTLKKRPIAFFSQALKGRMHPCPSMTRRS